MTVPMLYRLAIPTPWEHVPIGAGSDERIREIVARAVARAPRSTPPDQVAQARIRMTELLRAQLREAGSNGGVDYYLPTDLMHGLQLNSSFLVSEVVPDAMMPEGITGQVLAAMAADDDHCEPVSVGGCVWIRSDDVVARSADDTISEDIRVRRIDYVTAVPSDERRWYIVSFTTFGDGDPSGDFADAMVELFDAIMSTWRWNADA